MASLEQIQQDLQTLPQEALNEVYQFIQHLKKGSRSSQTIQPSTPSSIPATTAEAVDWSDLIGCVSVEENLSTTYKQVLAQGWTEKYDCQLILASGSHCLQFYN